MYLDDPDSGSGFVSFVLQPSEIKFVFRTQKNKSGKINDFLKTYDMIFDRVVSPFLVCCERCYQITIVANITFLPSLQHLDDFQS